MQVTPLKTKSRVKPGVQNAQDAAHNQDLNPMVVEGYSVARHKRSDGYPSHPNALLSVF